MHLFFNGVSFLPFCHWSMPLVNTSKPLRVLVQHDHKLPENELYQAASTPQTQPTTKSQKIKRKSHFTNEEERERERESYRKRMVLLGKNKSLTISVSLMLLALVAIFVSNFTNIKVAVPSSTPGSLRTLTTGSLRKEAQDEVEGEHDEQHNRNVEDEDNNTVATATTSTILIADEKYPTRSSTNEISKLVLESSSEAEDSRTKQRNNNNNNNKKLRGEDSNEDQRMHKQDEQEQQRELKKKKKKTDQPSEVPSARPTQRPSYRPSASPSDSPSVRPTQTPSHIPSASPSTQPSPTPYDFQLWPTPLVFGYPTDSKNCVVFDLYGVPVDYSVGFFPQYGSDRTSGIYSNPVGLSFYELYMNSMGGGSDVVVGFRDNGKAGTLFGSVSGAYFSTSTPNRYYFCANRAAGTLGTTLVFGRGDDPKVNVITTFQMFSAFQTTYFGYKIAPNAPLPEASISRYIFPTSAPSSNPTNSPTLSPSVSPSSMPTTAPTTAPSTSPTEDLFDVKPKHLYKFNELRGSTVHDSIGGKHGYIHGTGYTWISNQVIELKLSGSYGTHVVLPNDLLTSNSNTPGRIDPGSSFTVEVWMAVDGTGHYARAFDFGGYSDSIFWSVSRGGNNVHNDLGLQDFGVKGASAGTLMASPSTPRLTVGQIHQLTLVYDFWSKKLLYYKDGAFIQSVDVPNLDMSTLNLQNFYLGKSQARLDGYLNGRYRELRIYNAALSSTTISKHYQAGVHTATTLPSPVHLYTFDEVVQGNVIPDLIGLQHGIIKGINWAHHAFLDGSGNPTGGGELVLHGAHATDGNAAYVKLPDFLLQGWSRATIELWFTDPTHDTGGLGPGFWMRLFAFGYPDHDTGLAGQNWFLSSSVNYQLGHKCMQVKRSTGDTREVYETSGATFTPGVEQHIIATYDDQQQKMVMYWNGQHVMEVSTDIPLASLSLQKSWLGRSLYAADSYTHGRYNEVRIYDTAFTPQQVAASYQAGVTPPSMSKLAPVPPPPTPALIPPPTQAPIVVQTPTLSLPPSCSYTGDCPRDYYCNASTRTCERCLCGFGYYCAEDATTCLPQRDTNQKCSDDPYSPQYDQMCKVNNFCDESYNYQCRYNLAKGEWCFHYFTMSFKPSICETGNCDPWYNRCSDCTRYTPTSDNCSDGYYCYYPRNIGPTYASCKANSDKLKSGEWCNPLYIDSSYCESGVCGTTTSTCLGTAGDTCSVDADCATGKCADPTGTGSKTCQKFEVGDSCRNLDPATNCVSGKCSSVPDGNVCLGRAGDTTCSADSHCMTGICDNGTCQTCRLKTNDICRNPATELCLNPTSGVGNSCQAIKSHGQACSSDEECLTGRCNSRGVCGNCQDNPTATWLDHCPYYKDETGSTEKSWCDVQSHHACIRLHWVRKEDCNRWTGQDCQYWYEIKGTSTISGIY